jgi:hypothetical protein
VLTFTLVGYLPLNTLATFRCKIGLPEANPANLRAHSLGCWFRARLSIQVAREPQAQRRRFTVASYRRSHPILPISSYPQFRDSDSEPVRGAAHTDPSFTSRPPGLGSFEPALFFPAASLLTAGVPIRNGNIFRSQRSCRFFIRPRVKSSVGCHPSWNSTQFALVGCDRGQQQVLIAARFSNTS